MIELTLPPFGSARVWIDQHPTLAFEATHEMTRTFVASQRIGSKRRAGVELFVPAGARANYALICGSFAPDDLGRLILQLPVSSAGGEQLSWALAARVDEVRIGLPEEYAQSVLGAGSEAAEMLGSGTLIFAPTAHAIVGSSPRIFSQATFALVDIMALSPESVTNELLGEIFRSRLQ
jgi:hypothetical protein